jgi:hypothetical protein
MVLALAVLLASAIAALIFSLELRELLPALLSGRGPAGELSAEEQGLVSSLNDKLHAFLTIGTLVGLWALVQGLVATVRRRGRAQGIAAMVIAVAAPVLALVVYLVATAVEGAIA